MEMFDRLLTIQVDILSIWEFYIKKCYFEQVREIYSIEEIFIVQNLLLEKTYKEISVIVVLLIE